MSSASELKINGFSEICSKQRNQLFESHVRIHLEKCNDFSVEVEESKATKTKRKKRKKLTFGKPTSRRDQTTAKQYWAEDIEGVRLNAEHELLFLIKWEGYSSLANTWQSVKDLEDCDLLFAHFYEKQFPENEVTEYCGEDLKRFSAILAKLSSDACDLAVVLLLNDVTEEQTFDKKVLKRIKSRFEIWSSALRRARRQSHRWYTQIVIRECINQLEVEKQFKDFHTFLEFCEKREKLSEDLKQWENDVNAAIGQWGEARIRVQNNWDLEVPPTVTFLRRPKLSFRLENRLLDVQCFCANNCANRSCVCALKLYTDNKRFKTSHVIYECNDKCLCDVTCPNRRIQNGRRNALTVFRTRDRGWGVLTRARISFGDFIMEYIGEVIDSREANKRDSTYFFNIDEEFCGKSLFVDGKHFANITRFANHSCRPNMDLHFAFVNGLDAIPRITFFANKRIEANEELTYDYRRHFLVAKDGQYVRPDDDSGYDSRDSQRSGIQCLCGEEKCKRFL